MTPLYDWQQQDWLRLSQYRNQQRIPQALLIAGSRGLGKSLLAEQFAASLLCERPHKTSYLACGSCKPCKLLQAESHPDFFQLLPESAGKEIGIDAIRRLIDVLTLKPQYSQYRLIIINPSDRMNLRAQNAFLKCLEEPAERSVILLITERPAKLPATITSRCQQFIITKPPVDTVLAWLATQTSQSNLQLPYSLAQGAPLLALDYCNQSLLALRQNCFLEWLAVAKHEKSPVQIAENWTKLPETQLMAWLVSWVVDIIRNQTLDAQAPQRNPDLQTSLQQLAQSIKPVNSFKFYDNLLNCINLLDTAINKQLMFEALLIQWQTINTLSLLPKTKAKADKN